MYVLDVLVALGILHCTWVDGNTYTQNTVYKGTYWLCVEYQQYHIHSTQIHKYTRTHVPGCMVEFNLAMAFSHASLDSNLHMREGEGGRSDEIYNEGQCHIFTR